MGQLFGGSGGQSSGGNDKKKALEPRKAHIEQGAFFVATCDGAPREFENNGRRRWAISFREYPKHVYYAGYLQMKALAAVIGNTDSASAWEGQRVVMHAQQVDDMSDEGRKLGRKVWKFYAVTPEEWRETLRELDGEREGEAPAEDDTELTAVVRGGARKRGKRA